MKYYKKYLFKSNIDRITFDSGICEDLCNL